MWSKILIFLFTGIFLIGCNNRFVLRKNKLSENYDELITYIKKEEAKINTYSIKYTGSFENNERNLNFRGFLRIIRGEKIWISISPMGIEAARLLFTPTHIKFLNRHNKTYFITDYKYIEDKFNVEIDYSFIEQILTNRLMTVPETMDSSVVKTNEGLFQIQLDENQNATKKFVLNPKYQKLTSFIFKDVSQNADLSVMFNDYIDVKSDVLPQEIKVRLKKDNNFINLDLNYKKIIINSKFKVLFRIPSKYEQIWP